MREVVRQPSGTGSSSGSLALAGAFVATALVSAVSGAFASARLARWAARLAPEDLKVPGSDAATAPRVVVPLVKPGHDGQGRHGPQQQTTSNYDVGETMQHMRGAVKA
jgi:hypothetical protein